MRVLLVEDDGSTRRFLKVILEKLGYETTVCENAEDGWEAYQKQIHSLAVLDWLLPGMSGVELCRQIRAMPESAGTVILMSTSQTELSDVEIALKAGADDYIVKPVDITQMKIRLFIAEKRIQAQKDQQQVLNALQNKLKSVESQKPETVACVYPVLQPWRGVLMLPIPPNVDEAILPQVRQQWLQTIQKRQGRQIIFDFSEVVVLESKVAAGLINIMQTIKLVGARTILVGLAGEVAQALVATGGDLGHVDGFGTLAEGLQEALKRMQYKVVTRT